MTVSQSSVIISHFSCDHKNYTQITRTPTRTPRSNTGTVHPFEWNWTLIMQVRKDLPIGISSVDVRRVLRVRVPEF